MLRYSDAEGFTAVGRAATPLRLIDGAAVIDLTTPTPESPRPAVLAEPASAIPQRDRRAVGRNLRALGHLLDAASLALPFLVFDYVKSDVVSMRVVALFVVIGTILLWPTHRKGRSAVAPGEGLLSIVARIGLAPVITFLLLSLGRLGQLADEQRFIDVVAIVQIVVVTLPLVLLGRILSYQLIRRSRARGYDLEDTLIVGSGPVGMEVASALCENPQFGLVPCGFVDRFDDEDLGLPLVGRPEDLPEILAATGVRQVVLAFGAAGEEELVSIIRRCHDTTVQFYAVPRLFELGVSHDSVGQELDGLPLVPVRRPGTSSQMWPVKRALDLVAASLLMLITLPLFAACALAVKLTSSGPVFFRQVRIGIGGRPFEILKFRTMKVNDDSATQWSVDDDDRVTLVGRFLRPSHLDELPQLINVLRGEMSLVGPRPERPHFVEQFGAEIDDYHFRHRVPVGITGWAQVNGYWGDTSIERRVRLDNRYIENWSLWRDVVIFLRTIPTLLGRRR